MSHITCQAERDENEEIWKCPHRAVSVLKHFVNDWTGETESEWGVENQCGEWKTLSPAKDRCVRCNKVFTY